MCTAVRRPNRRKALELQSSGSSTAIVAIASSGVAMITIWLLPAASGWAVNFFQDRPARAPVSVADRLALAACLVDHQVDLVIGRLQRNSQRRSQPACANDRNGLPGLGSGASWLDVLR